MLHFPRWKVILVGVVLLTALLFSLPNLFPRATMEAMPGWIPHRQVNLGLDLQGGAHLLYQLDEKEMLDDWLESVRDDVRETLRRGRIPYTDLRQDVGAKSVSVRMREGGDYEKALTELRKLAVPVGGAFGSFTAANNLEVTGGDNSSVLLKTTEAGLNQRMSSGIEASIETIRRRVDAFGTTEPSIQRQGRNRILVQVPGISDVERLKKLIGETGKLEFKLVDTTVNASEIAATKQVPPDDQLLYSTDKPPVPYVVKRQTMVSGENLVDAQPGFDQRTNEPIVTFRFDSTGARRFGRVTQENVGLPFAIILDGKIISAPVIREPILGGTGQISGNFTVQEANDLAVLLRSGALPAKLTVIEERIVGASLGADSIEAGTKATWMGLALVVIFMFVGYGLFGVFANIALVFNIVLIFAVLSMLGATLTLPGIAGIVLTIGIAVDANILINERVREEIRSGKSPVAAVEAGYSRAMTTIIDSNVTTLLATTVLFWLGSGPVRGFAITLTIGILASMFTAVTVTRLMVSTWLRWARPAAIPI